MNIESDQIERLLRRAPQIPAPSGLLADLKTDIALSPSRNAEPVTEYTPSFFKRWLPALSVAIWLLACLVILAVQSNQLNKLRLENDAARAAMAEAQQPIPSGQSELMRLRAEAEEAQKLRAEIAQLTEQVQQLESLKAENQRLVSEAKEIRLPKVPPAQDFFATAAQKQENAACINNLKQVGLGARMWANDNKDLLPSTFDQMQKELPNRAVLFCPASEGTVQFEMVSPGAPETDPQVVYARCPKHNHVVLCDGSAHMLSKDFRLVVRPDGKTVIGK